VALTDQWYLTYGEEEWQRITLQALEQLETYSEEAKNSFRHCLGECVCGGGVVRGVSVKNVAASPPPTRIWVGEFGLRGFGGVGGYNAGPGAAGDVQ
jgi:hypothetical protein